MKTIAYRFLVALLAISFLTACEKKPQSLAPIQIKKPALVETVAIRTVPIIYQSVGSLVADKKINVSSKLSGYVQELLVEEGDVVRENQLLLTIESNDAEGRISVAEAAVNSAEFMLEDAIRDTKRNQRLYERGAISKRDMQKYYLHEERVKDNLAQALSHLSVAIEQRQYTQIKSRIEGVVIERLLKNGDLVTPGKTILTIESKNQLMFESFLPAKYLGQLKQGQRVKIHLDTANKKLEGIVHRIIPEIDPVSHKYKIKIAIEKTEDIYPGMYGLAAITVGEKKIIAIHENSVKKMGGLSGALLVDESDTVKFRWLQFGSSYGEYLEVRAGLSKGEKLIAALTADFNEGDRVAYREGSNQ